MRTRLTAVLAERERGLTLVELMVAAVLFGVLGTTALSMLLAAQRSAGVTVEAHQSIEEARLALNRVSRELRQATALTYVQNADGSARDDDAITVVSFVADFNGDGCAATTNLDNPSAACPAQDPADPEELTYCHEPPAVTGEVGRLYVIGGPVSSTVTSCAGIDGQPILAGGVDRFHLTYRSSLYRHDVAPADGTTTWSELDAALPPVGNGNASLDVELASIDRISVELTVAGGTDRDYRTSVTLRNKN